MNDWTRFENYLTDINILKSIAGVLSWDQHTNLPPNGANLRSEQTGMLSTLIHQKIVDPILQRLSTMLKRFNRDQAKRERYLRHLG